MYTETESYDGYGRLSTATDFAGNQTVYGYDTLGRVHTKTLYAKSISTAGETITYNFDNYGRNSNVVDVIGSTTRTTTYGYDIENRVTSVSASVTTSGLTTQQGTINYGYDQVTGRHIETSTTYPPSTTINSDIKYGYDQLGRLQTVNVVAQNGQTTNLTITYYYTSVGTIDHITYPNGTETDYGYDTLNRVTSVKNKISVSGNLLSSYSYTLNADGLRTGVTETDNVPPTVTRTWTYDNLQRLTGEAVVSSNSYTDTYTYDLVGNRLSKTDVAGTTTTVTTGSFNTDDQLTSETGTVNNVSSWSTGFQYDPNGSLTSVSRTGSGAETDNYTYDLQKRLSGATIRRSENGQTVNITASYTP